MHADPLLDALLADVPATPVRLLVVGLNWVLVRTGGGACGLAHAPPRGGPGCAPLDGAGQQSGRSLADLAALVRSANPVAVAVGIAAINAARPAPDGAIPGNGLDLFQGISDRTVVAGRFPGLAARLPGSRIIEREPAAGEIGEDAAADVLATAAGLVMTASALANGGVSRYLGMVPPGTLTALVGPGTPFSPRLHRAGIRELAGIRVEDADGLARAVMEGGATRAMAPFVSNVVFRG